MREAEIRDLFERCGRVLNLRFVDPEKESVPVPQQRGRNAKKNDTHIGFCDFTDEASARTCVDRLNGFMLDAAHRLRVVLSERKRPREDGTDGDPVGEPFLRDSALLPADDPIQQQLVKMDVAELYEAVEQLRVLCIEKRSQAAALLEVNPQLRYAVTLILQHAGHLPKDLPPEASQAIATRAKPKVEQVVVKREEDAASTAMDAQTAAIEAMKTMSPGEIRDIMDLTEADFKALDAETAIQMRLLRDQILLIAQVM